MNLATFVRILGNDLYPRHAEGQTIRNLEFILENEEPLIDCNKVFILNRILSNSTLSKIKCILNKHKATFIEIPFKEKDYRKIDWDLNDIPPEKVPYRFHMLPADLAVESSVLMRIYRNFNNYVMNNNGARNIALENFRNTSKWILPWDGNCFMTKKCWLTIRECMQSRDNLDHIIVPMTRVLDNLSLLDDEFKPSATEEPQVIFKNTSNLKFNEEYYYGRRPKVELLWQLGVPGPWDSWKIHDWDIEPRSITEHKGNYKVAGWVARLFSGNINCESEASNAINERGSNRVEAILKTIATINLEQREFNLGLVVRKKYQLTDNEKKLLHQEADKAMQAPLYSVIHKTTLAPSGNPNDYWHPSPYWWPNPDTSDGLPYVWRDSERVKGTNIDEDGSEKYDRNSLHYMFFYTYILCLAHYLTRNSKYSRKATEFIQTWFVDDHTKMNPHLRYAQIRLGHDYEGIGTGIIEFKDLYYFLDAVEYLENNDLLNDKCSRHLHIWFEEYITWLLHSRKGLAERAEYNNHGTYMTLQLLSIAKYLNKTNLMQELFVETRLRFNEQFSEDGDQPYESKRKNKMHYLTFNLQGFINLIELCKRCGDSINMHLINNRAKYINIYLSYTNSLAEHRERKSTDFDEERALPIIKWFVDNFNIREEVSYPPEESFKNAKPLFHAHDGIKPYWRLTLT